MVQTDKQQHPSGDNRFKLLDRAVTKHQSRGDALFVVLHVAQRIFGYQQNDMAMNSTVKQTVLRFIEGKNVTGAVLNRIEAGFRCFDPCLSCSTDAAGQMPLTVEVYDALGTIVDECSRRY